MDAIVNSLIEFYFADFGGKVKGRYFLSRNCFLDLCSKTYLRQDFLDNLQDVLASKGFLLIDVGKGFVLFELPILMNYRSVPKKLIRV